MKTFYLLRHEDVNGNSGTGVVAEGVIFDTGMCAMTWLSNIPTVASYRSISDVKKLHGHGGKTEVVIENCKKDEIKFQSCKEAARLKKIKQKHEETP